MCSSRNISQRQQHLPLRDIKKKIVGSFRLPLVFGTDSILLYYYFWLTFREGWSTIDRQLEMNSFVILQLPASWEIGEQKTIRVCLSFSFVFLFDWCYIFLLLKVFPSMRGLLWRTTLFGCVFNRSDETILLEHILHHHPPCHHFAQSKVASSYRITYLCRIICYRG